MRQLYSVVQCVACSAAVFLFQLAPALFVRGIVQHCPDVDAQLKRFARQFESAKLATSIAGSGLATTDTLARGRDLCYVVRPSQLTPDAFVSLASVGEHQKGVAPDSLEMEKSTHPDFFVSHSWSDSPEEKWAPSHSQPQTPTRARTRGTPRPAADRVPPRTVPAVSCTGGPCSQKCANCLRQSTGGSPSCGSTSSASTSGI